MVSGGLLLDRNGARFVNELGLRDQVTNSIFDHSFNYNNIEGQSL